MQIGEITDAMSWLGNAALAIAAVYVASRGLRGHFLEKKAETLAGTERREAEADARVYHAMMSLQNPWVLWCVVLGAVLQLLADLVDLLK